MYKKLIDKIIKCLENENSNRVYYDDKEIDIPFYISVLEQSLGNSKYKDLHNDLENLKWDVVFIDEEEYYTEFKIQVYFENIEINYSYMIIFEYDERHTGYCQCSKNDDNYNELYDCCGIDCDWDAPKFSIIKMCNIGSSSFKGEQRDYWGYKDKYYSITREKEKEENLNKIKMLKEQKARIEEKIKELENVY